MKPPCFKGAFLFYEQCLHSLKENYNFVYNGGKNSTIHPILVTIFINSRMRKLSYYGYKNIK
jgi:hypothetical protein